MLTLCLLLVYARRTQQPLFVGAQCSHRLAVNTWGAWMASELSGYSGSTSKSQLRHPSSMRPRPLPVVERPAGISVDITRLHCLSLRAESLVSHSESVLVQPVRRQLLFWSCRTRTGVRASLSDQQCAACPRTCQVHPERPHRGGMAGGADLHRPAGAHASPASQMGQLGSFSRA